MARRSDGSPLRSDLLAGRTVVVAAPPPPDGRPWPYAGAVSGQCEALGARVLALEVVDPPAGGEPQAQLRPAVGELLAGGPVHALVVDGAALFAAARGGRPALVRCLDGTWSAARPLVKAAFVDGAGGGRVVLIAPPTDAGEHAEGAVAGLENLARTLSTEWARHRVTTVAIAPSAGETAAGETATLVAYLASAAGDYFSGCLLDLRGPLSGRP
jgi:NAD(P)-dependent dehydrogenase (short-subunit alcohol dehydrogenase family)